jgi:hypothetical protein
MARKRPKSMSLRWSAWLLLWLSWLTRVEAQTVAAEPTAPALPEAPAPVTPQATSTPVVPELADPPGYAELIDAAIREHELSHFQEARELLLKAHALFPNARTLRGLGKVEYELRNYGHAVTHLERALASPVRALDPRLRAEVEELLLRARAYVGEVHVAVEPSTASVIVDGVTVASGPQASFSLMVGDHLIEFHAAGHFPERRSVRIKGGEQTNIQVVLNAPNEGSERTAATGTKKQDTSKQAVTRKRWLAWTLSIAAVATTGLVLGLALRDDDPERSAGGSSGVVLRNP